MKKLLAVLALLALSTVSYAKEVVSGGDGIIYIVDGKKVYVCSFSDCYVVTDDYKKLSIIQDKDY